MEFWLGSGKQEVMQYMFEEKYQVLSCHVLTYIQCNSIRIISQTRPATNCPRAASNNDNVYLELLMNSGKIARKVQGDFQGVFFFQTTDCHGTDIKRFTVLLCYYLT